MNYLQFLIYLTYLISTLIWGIGIYLYVSPDKKDYINRPIFLGETLLLGNSFIIGIFILLSMISCYNSFFLSGTVLLAYSLLIIKTVRQTFIEVLARGVKWDLFIILWIILLLFFVFRNCYFTIDVDSITNYLHAQKVWLERSSSLAVTRADNYTTFLPQADIIPAALGLSFFPKETLYAQLIHIHWRLIAFILIFGYTSHRFNTAFGLAATMFILFNDHMYYSGANLYVLINAATVAFLFASAYNFFEASERQSRFRFILAIIFCMQVIGNKYQLLYCIAFMFGLGVLIQGNILTLVKEFINDKRLVIVFSLFSVLSMLWLIKNFIITGNPFFPILAGRLNSFGWVREQELNFVLMAGGLNPLKFVKYASFFFIWPGIHAAKLVCMTLLSLPLIIISPIIFKRLDQKATKNLCYWLMLSFLMIMGTAMASFVDPRYFRYCISIIAFAAVVSLQYILQYCFNLKHTLMCGLIVIVIAVPGYKIMFSEGGIYKRPYYKENIDVILNKIHTKQALKKHYPGVIEQQKKIERMLLKYPSLAYYAKAIGNFPLFFTPTLPIVGVHRSTIVHWDSYKSEELIIKDLKDNNIHYLYGFWDDGSVMNKEEFAKHVVNTHIHPKVIMSNYGLPEELRRRE